MCIAEQLKGMGGGGGGNGPYTKGYGGGCELFVRVIFDITCVI